MNAQDDAAGMGMEGGMLAGVGTLPFTDALLAAVTHGGVVIPVNHAVTAVTAVLSYLRAHPCQRMCGLYRCRRLWALK